MKRTDSILQQFYMSELPKAQKGLSITDLTRQMQAQNVSRGDMQSYYPQIQRMRQQPEIDRLKAQNIEIARQKAAAERQGTIKAAQPRRSAASKAWAVATNPMTALSYKMPYWSAGKEAPDLPDYFERGEREGLDMATDIINPFGYVNAAKNALQGMGRVAMDPTTIIDEAPGIALNSLQALPLLGTTSTLKSAGRYITTQTPVRNTYKINPFAYKGSNTSYYRGVGKEGMEDALAQGYFRGKPNVQRVNFPGTNLNAAKSFGNTTYWSPKISTATEYGQGIIAEVPRNVAKFAQKYSKSPWSQFTNQRIGTDQARFLQKDWLRGYREIPTVYTDVRKMTPSNIGKYVDLSTDVSGGTGVHNLGVYPMKRDNRILFKVGFENKRNPIFEADYTPEDMVALTKNLDPRFFGKTYKSIGLSPKQAGLFKQAGNRNMQYFTGDRQNYDLTGNVISRVEGRNLEQLAAEDIADIPQSAYQRYIDDIVDLDNKGITYDIFGDNFVYDPAVQRFKLFDLSSKSGVSPIQFNPYGLTPSSSGNKTIMQLDKAKLRENLNQKLRGRFLNDINSDDKMGAYGDDDIVNMFNAIYDRIKNTKKTGGAIIDPRGQWAYPGMNTIVPTPTGQITMQGVPYPVYGQDETGYSQMMYPDGEYKFPGQMVYETPMMQRGGRIIKQREDFKPWWNWASRKAGDVDGRQDAFGTLGDLYAYYAGQPLHYNTLEYSQYKPSKAKNPNANYISINDPKFKQEVFDKYNDVFIKKELGKGKLQAQKINDSTYSVSGYTPATRKQFEEAKKLGTHPVYMKGKEYVSNAIGRYFISKGKDEKGDYISYYDTFDEGSGPDGGGIGEMLKLTKPFEIYDRIYLDPKTGKPKMQRGGQHGGLDRWFAEKWVDVKTGKTCGRQEGENRAYPACRPSRRVSSQTPKTSSEMSPAEKAKFKRTKTSSERIPYNHKRMQKGGTLPEYQIRGQVMSSADSVRHQADKILKYEQLRGGPGGAPLPQYADPKYMSMLMNNIYPEVKRILPNASAMEAAEAMDFIFNAGWDQTSNKILKDPRAYALQEYYKQYNSSKLDADGKWSGRKNPAYSFDQEYNATIGRLPENERRVLMNRGRDWYYKNINNPAPGVPHPNYNDTWYGRIWNTNDFLPFNPNNPNFKPNKK